MANEYCHLNIRIKPHWRAEDKYCMIILLERDNHSLIPSHTCFGNIADILMFDRGIGVPIKFRPMRDFFNMTKQDRIYFYHIPHTYFDTNTLEDFYSSLQDGITEDNMTRQVHKNTKAKLSLERAAKQQEMTRNMQAGNCKWNKKDDKNDK